MATIFEAQALDLIFQILGRLAILQSIFGPGGGSGSGAGIFDALAGLNDKVDALQAAVDADKAVDDTTLANLNLASDDLLAAISAAQQTGSPVTLPSAPSGYGGLDATATGNAVWDTVSPTTGYDYASMLDWVYNATKNLEKSASYIGRRNPYFSISGPWSSFSHVSPDYNEWPNFDITLISPTSTVLGILNASNPGMTWFADPDGQHHSSFWAVLGNYEFHCLVDDAQLYLLKQGILGAALAISPPVWPGLAAATLGTPVALSTGLTITDVMDGVIVNLSGVPARSNFWQFDDKPSYRNLGALSFFNDDGEQEVVQVLGFEQQIYTPKTMQHAAGVKLRTSPGVSGTLTPWTITP